MPDEQISDRDQNALLTTTQRAFLADQGNYFTGDHARQMRHEKRQEIVNRVRHGLLDFPLLYDHLRPAELEAIFDDADLSGLDRAAAHAIAVLFLGLADKMAHRTPAQGAAVNVDGGHVSPAFEAALEEGLRRGYRRRGYLLETARLDVTSQGPIADLEDILSKLADGVASREEVLYVLETTDIPIGSIQEPLLETLQEYGGLEGTGRE